MSAVELPRIERDDLYSYGDHHGRPGWRKLLPFEDGNSVILRLTCGHVVTLGREHKLSDNGKVIPGVICTIKDGHQKCGFNHLVVLRGYSP